MKKPVVKRTASKPRAESPDPAVEAVFDLGTAEVLKELVGPHEVDAVALLDGPLPQSDGQVRRVRDQYVGIGHPP